MTAQEAIIEVHERLGEPSDLPIETGGLFDIAAYGSVRILRALNAACDYVATYKAPTTANGRPLYFRALERTATWEPTSATCTLPAQTDTTFKTLVLDVALSASAAGRFNGWMASIGTDVRRVLRHTVAGGVGTIVLDKPLGADASALTLTLRPREFEFGDADGINVADRVFETLRVYDLESGGELERSVDALHIDASGVGTPGAWSKRGSAIVFDVASDSATRSYAVDFVALPTPLTLATAQFALPLAFHEPIVVWATRWGYSRMMESTMAYALKRDFEDLMRTLQTQIDAEDFLGGDYIVPVVGG